MLDVLVQSRRNAKAAKRFLGKLMRKQGRVPRVLVTDKLASYVVAHRELMPSVEHRRSKYLNNRAENSHQPTRQREHAMKGFRSSGAAQRFLAVFSAISPHFRPGRHKLTALMSVPDYCGPGSGVDAMGLTCRVGSVGQGEHFTRTVTMTAGPRSTADGLPIAVIVAADEGAVRVRSGEVTVRVSTTAGVCDPHGVPVSDRAATPDGSVVADGRIAGLVTSGPAEFVTIEGADQCAHAIVRSVTPVAGRFAFVGLLPGMYRVTVDGRAPVEVVLSPPCDVCERVNVLTTDTRIPKPDMLTRRLFCVSNSREILGGSCA